MKALQALLLSIIFLDVPIKAEISIPTLEVLSLSGAIIDHFLLMSEEEFQLVQTEKGAWKPIEYSTLDKILENNAHTSLTFPGGSGVNVMKGLTYLNHRCAVLGKIGADQKGEFFCKRIQNLGIETHMEKANLPTSQALCLITPDAERTFQIYQGASHAVTDMELNDQLFEEATMFHMEGFQFVYPNLALRALKKAKQAGMSISIDLGNKEIVRRHKEWILDILPEYVDYVFCNEDEARALTHLPPKDACIKLASFCKVAVVTMSEKGCWTQGDGSIFYTPPLPVTAIDTTGAGDFFTSGFLHGILMKKPLRMCAWIGSLLASYIVQIIGTEIPENFWEEIYNKVEKGERLN